MLAPHHDGSPLHVSTQTPALGDTVRVRLRVPAGEAGLAGLGLAALDAVSVRSNPNHEPRFAPAVLLGERGGWAWWQAEVEVENPVHGYRFLLTGPATDAAGTGLPAQRWLNATGLHATETLDADDFKLVASPEGIGAPPAWLASSVLYQVFPDRFARSAAADGRALPEWAIAAAWGDPVDLEPPARSTQFYGGDLDGLTQRLGHLADLGVTLLYLTPIFAGRSNHRYDATSFDAVDPLLGGDEALVRLVEAAHARGIRVIGDLTSNHSGDAHEWFLAAHHHPEAPESDFYHWKDADNDGYESWLGVPSLPKFNWASAELRRRFIEGPDSVVARWLKPPFNLDGWRIDVANMTGRLGAEDLNAEVRQTIRRTMVEVNPDTILLGESTNDAASDFQGDAWHGAMTYTTFTRPLWSWLMRPGSPAAGGIGFAGNEVPVYTGRQFFEAHTRFVAGYPWRTRLGTLNALNTHDTPRFATSALPGAVPVALGLSVTLPGIPVVFAGDEFGLSGVDGEASRTPIPWSLLEQDRASDAGALAHDTTRLYTELIALRRSQPALNGGGMRWLHIGDEVLVFVRESEENSVLVTAGRGDFSVTIPVVALGLAAGGWSGLHPLFGAEVGGSPGVQLAESDGEIRLSGQGPRFAAWAFSGVKTP